MPPYNNQQSFYQSPTGLYHPTMDSSTSSQANQPYSPLNRVTLDMDFEQLIQEYYPTQYYFMGQGSTYGSAHGSAPVDDDSPVEEMSPVKAKKPSKQYKGAKKSKTFETTSGSASGGFNLNNEADEFEEETQKQRPMGRDRSKAKNKSSASAREGSSSFVDLVADKFFNIKSTKWGKMKEQQDSYIQLKNRELDIQEVARRDVAELKREKLAIRRRTLELAEKRNGTKTSYSII
ncbi:hypothetical protein Tco_1514721 [Tanacetum coccineum]